MNYHQNFALFERGPCSSLGFWADFFFLTHLKGDKCATWKLHFKFESACQKSDIYGWNRLRNPHVATFLLISAHMRVPGSHKAVQTLHDSFGFLKRAMQCFLSPGSAIEYKKGEWCDWLMVLLSYIDKCFNDTLIKHTHIVLCWFRVVYLKLVLKSLYNGMDPNVLTNWSEWSFFQCHYFGPWPRCFMRRQERHL